MTLVVLGLVVILWYRVGLRYYECPTYNRVYGDLNGKLVSFGSDPMFQHTLKDYYIKGAYNCCCVGAYKNDYVEMCMLKNVLKQGVRFLDFELYSLNNQPVIAASTSDSYHVKETFNSIPFAEALQVVIHYAFSLSTAPNPTDPIFLHLRIRSANPALYSALATMIQTNDPDNRYFLSPEYSYENQHHNLGDVPLQQLKQKIVLIVDGSNPAYKDCAALTEYINMVSQSSALQMLRFYDIKYAPSMAELVESNKTSMTVAIPDRGAQPPNPNSVILRETGCQFLAMQFQTIDTQLEENNVFFDNHRSAFVLKPEALRYVPVELPIPPMQNPDVSYATRTVRADYYQFDM